MPKRVTYEVKERDGTLVAAAVGMDLDNAIERLRFWLTTDRNVRIWTAGFYPHDAADWGKNDSLT